jgi:hypothetical protein
MRRALPARFTIERKSRPLSRRRFLSTAADGGKCWDDTVDTFVNERAARSYLDQRLGAHANDAVVVRHTVH